MKVNGLLITFAQYFKIFIEITLYPDECSILRDFIVFITSVSVIFISVVLSE